MTLRVLALIALAILWPGRVDAQPAARVTVLYDAFGNPSDLKKDWGFAALVEYGGRRILFDTGNNAGFFKHNVERLKVDLTRLDAAVLSHRHGDHTSGLAHLIAANPALKIYAPQEGAFFRGGAPPGFFTPHPGLPPNLKYFDGKPPAQYATGSPWPNGNFEIVTATKEIFPGVLRDHDAVAEAGHRRDERGVARHSHAAGPCGGRGVLAPGRGDDLGKCCEDRPAALPGHGWIPPGADARSGGAPRSLGAARHAQAPARGAGALHERAGVLGVPRTVQGALRSRRPRVGDCTAMTV